MRWLHELLLPVAILTLLVSFWTAAAARSAQQKASHLVLPPADPKLYPTIVAVYGDSAQK